MSVSTFDSCIGLSLLAMKAMWWRLCVTHDHAADGRANRPSSGPGQSAFALRLAYLAGALYLGRSLSDRRLSDVGAIVLS